MTGYYLEKVRRWENQHQNFTASIEGRYFLELQNPTDARAGYRARAADVARLLGEIATSQHPLHAMGSGWSMSEVAVTNGYLLNDKNDRIILVPRADERSTAFAGDSEGLYLVQAGISILHLNRYLQQRGRALPTTGASNGQTLAGAISTGTHGSAIDEGVMTDFVRALHVVTGAGRQLWIEPATPERRALTSELPDELGAVALRDDAIFDSARLALGGFGVIVGALIETVPLFLLETHTVRIPDDAALAEALESMDLSSLPLPHGAERPHHFSLILNPHRPRDPVLATVMYRRPYRADYEPIRMRDEIAAPGDDLVEFLGRFLDFLPASVDSAIIPDLVTLLLNERYPTSGAQWGTQGEIFTSTTTRGKIASFSFAVPLDQTNATRALLERLHAAGAPYPGAFGVRFVSRSTATLAFARWSRSAIFEIDGGDHRKSRDFYRRVARALAASGIPHAYHWGKVHFPDPQRTRACFGADLDTWREARGRVLTTPQERACFDSPFLRDSGLTA